MPLPRFECVDGFAQTLEEVETLVHLADLTSDDDRWAATLNKAALLLLTGKFENFAELAAEEFIFQINRLGLRASAIPHELRLQHTFSAIKKIERLNGAHQRSDIIRIFTEVGALWAADAEFSALNVDCKFSYGKHGETELRRLFASIGVPDIFEAVTVLKPAESMAGGQGSAEFVPLDFRGTFNSVTNIRNNILHQDASPNLTSNDIREYLWAFREFASGLASLLSTRIADMQALV